MAIQSRRNKHKSQVTLDEALARVERLAYNLQWTWNVQTQRLFASLDAALWQSTNHNPIQTIRGLSPDRRATLAADPTLIDRIEACERDLQAYMKAKPWFAREMRGKRRKLQVAYFCAEFGIHECLPLYSGGLGILAGDHLKSASDLGVPLVGVGLMYRNGYYQQKINADGTTKAVYPDYDYTQWPIENTGYTIDVPMGRRTVRVGIWRAEVGRVSLLLLDSDMPGNRPEDRQLTGQLYGGDREYRLKQEMLLGVGGMAALNECGFSPTVFHLNEGHAAFCIVDRLRQYVQAGDSLDQATQQVQRSTVFTTHTPVDAGHERFDPNLVMKYIGPIVQKIDITRKQFLGLARTDAANKNEPFCMTTFALRHSHHRNGVAELHGDTSRKMWTDVFDATTPDDVPIGHVTNGIHSQTWLFDQAQTFYDLHLKPDWQHAYPDDDHWKRAHTISADAMWRFRCMLRKHMVDFIRQTIKRQIVESGGLSDASKKTKTSSNAFAASSMAALEILSDSALTIGFARRFATYKRAPLIFSQPDRLSKILNNPKRPVQLIFAGKAHPADVEGQQFLQRIHKFSHDPRFRGRVILLENYDINIGRHLVGGCDVWLNNPRRPNEASGTSGMKGPLHGGLNCSILDGWWPEAFNGKNGWAIGDEQTFKSMRKHDAHDAEALFETLEKGVVPAFYQRDRSGIPKKWVSMMAESMKTVCAEFSALRMVGEYVDRYYLPAHA